MRRVGCALLFFVGITGCVTQQKKGQSPEAVLMVPKARYPTSTTKDYISLVENANSPIKGYLSGQGDLVAAKSRMEAIFESARHESIDFFSQLRSQRPILFSKGAQGTVFGKDAKIPNIFLVTRNADVMEVLNRHDVFSVAPYRGIMEATVGAPYMLARENHPANAEKPEMHRYVDGKKNAVKVRAIIAHLAEEAIKNGAYKGELDLVKSVSRAVPLGMNEEYFGFNGPDRESLARWSRATQHAFFHDPFKDKEVMKKSVKAGREMRDYIRQTLIPQRTQELANGRPANDVVSQVLKLSSVHSAAGVSDERIVSNIIGLLVGSVETTSAAIAQSLEVIMKNQQVLDYAIRAAQNNDDDLIARITWEALRFNPVNPWLGRYSESDYVLAKGTDHETLIPKGSLVLASTESAMWDDEVFPNPQEFRFDRDPSKYLHLGELYHRCLGDDVALIMVPETVKQVLKLRGIRMKSPIDQQKGPFPEKFLVNFDPSFRGVQDEEANKSPNLAGTAALVEFVGYKLADKNRLAQISAMMKDVATGPGSKKDRAIEAMPPLVASLLENMTPAEKVDACMTKNPRSVDLFPNVADRRNYCSVRLDFRACYFVQRTVAGQSSFTSYYRCAYGQGLMTPEERADFKSKMAGHEMFYFLNFEN